MSSPAVALAGEDCGETGDEHSRGAGAQGSRAAIPPTMMPE
jgi:hypothetical protein